jgi:hypothetical protein
LVEVVLLGVLELELRSLLLPGVGVVVLLAEPDALWSVLLPGVVLLPAPMDVPPLVVSVLPGVVVLAVPLVVSLGVVVVLEVVDEVEAASSCLLQALRDRAAIRARAAHCAIGDLIIRKLLEGC